MTGMRSFLKYFILFIGFIPFFSGCRSPQSQSVEEDKKPADATTTDSNFLSMKVNGVSWKADHEIIAIFHPKGYNNAILISGKKGAKDKTEQTFNLNLYNAAGAGVFDFVTGNKDNSEVQLANLSDEHYLYGNVLGFSFHVQITKASQNPAMLEASFEGVLTGNSGDSIKISEGKFYYHE